MHSLFFLKQKTRYLTGTVHLQNTDWNTGKDCVEAVGPIQAVKSLLHVVTQITVKLRPLISFQSARILTMPSDWSESLWSSR